MDFDTGAPKDELHPETIAWCKSLGVQHTKLSEILAAGPCPKVCLEKKSNRLFTILKRMIGVL